MRSTLLVCTVFCLAVLMGGCRHATTGTSGMPVPYTENPNFSTNPFALGAGGEWGTGLGVADINGDGLLDLVVSAGNDKANQHVSVYFNNGNGIDEKPGWVSEDTDHHGTLAVGDIDGNGYPDVAVSIFLGPDLAYTGGGIKVYYNAGPPNYLSPTPTFVDRGYPSYGCSLGDMDGDGDLDLAVAGGEPIPEVESFATQQCGAGNSQNAKHSVVDKMLQTQEPPFVTPGRIYINDNGSFSKTNVWMTNDTFVSMATEFADVNYDGIMDVIFQSAPVRIYLGAPATTTPSFINSNVHWVSVEENYYGNGMDYAASMTQPADFEKPSFSIATSSNSYMGQGRGGFSLYRFLSPFVIQYKPYTSTANWNSKYGDWGSGVRLGDVDNDGNLDMLTHRWNTPGKNDLNGHLLIYGGNGGLFTDTPVWQSAATSIIEVIQMADLDNSDVAVKNYYTTVDGSEWPSTQKGLSVMYLPEQIIHDIHAVAVNGMILPEGSYTHVPGRNWISFAKPIPDKSKLAVQYSRSTKLDVIYTNWNCDLGNYIYYHQ